MKTNRTADPVMEEEGDETSLVDILMMVWLHKWLLILATLCGMLVGMLAGQLAPDSFSAAAVVHLEPRTQSVTLPEEVIGQALGAPVTFRGLETEKHIIRSRLILGPVAEELNLDWRAEPRRLPVFGHMVQRIGLPGFVSGFLTPYAQKGDALILGRLEVPERLIGTKIRIESLGAGRFKADMPDGSSGIGSTGEDLRIGDGSGVVLNIATFTAPAGRIWWVWRAPFQQGVSLIRNGLSVRERAGSTILDFRYQGADRRLCQLIANGVVKSYQTQSLQRRSAEIDQGIDFIEEQLPAISAAVTRATDALNAYTLGRQQEELSLGTQDLLSQAVELEAQLEELRFQQDQLAQRVTENHPDYRALQARRTQVETRLSDLRAQIKLVPATEQELLRLTEAAAMTREIERKMIERSEQLRVLKASTVGNIQVLEPADSASRVGPNRQRPMMAGAVIGMVLAVALILLMTLLRRGIDDAHSVEELGLPLFATVGWVRGLSGRRRDPKLYALAASDPQSVVTETFRGLRTGLQFSLATASKRSLMITSCAPSDGKSFISLNLAIVWGQAGEKVLLIDADMRRGVLRKQFGLGRDHKGLSDYLANKAELGDVVVSDAEKQIDFIPAGSYPPNPAELLNTPAFRRLLDEAAEHYDLVIIDAPPTLAVTDPGIIGQMVGMSLLVVKHMATTPAEILSSLKVLGGSGVKPSGAIITQFNVNKSRYGRYGAKYRYYGSYSYKYDSVDQKD
jgi:tyrosine-protein kinase Etk/Wzc